jgi:hypothetical protein
VADGDAGVELALGAEPPEAGAAPALVPKIAPMIFPNMLILTSLDAAIDRRRFAHAIYRFHNQVTVLLEGSAR